MTISAVRNNVPATRSRSTGNSSGYSSRTTAALALVAAIVLADVMSFGRVGEYFYTTYAHGLLRSIAYNNNNNNTKTTRFII